MSAVKDRGSKKGSRTIGVEDAGYADLDTILAVVAVGKGFCDPLALVVAGTRADWVDVAPTSERAMISGRTTWVETTY